MCDLSHEVLHEINGHRLLIPVVLCKDIPVDGGIIFPEDIFAQFNQEEIEGAQ